MSGKTSSKSIAGILFGLALIGFVYCIFYENISIMAAIIIGAILCLCYAGLEFYQKDAKMELKAEKISKIKTKLKEEQQINEELKSHLQAAEDSKQIYEKRYQELSVRNQKLEILVVEQKKKLDYIEGTFKN